MSVSRPTCSLVGKYVSPSRTFPALSCHNFHTSVPRPKRRTRFTNVKAEELGLLKPAARKDYQKEKMPEYTAEELKTLEARYTPGQLEALKAGETAVDVDDLVLQGRLRADPYKPNYMEDFSVMDPRFDIKPASKVTPSESPWPSMLKWSHQLGQGLMETSSKKASDQLTRAMIRALRKVKQEKGEDLIVLTDEQLDAMDKDPSLVQEYMNRPQDPEPPAGASGPEYMTQIQAEKLDAAIDEAWESELKKIGAGERDNELKETWFEQIQHGPDGENQMHSAIAPELPKIPGVAGLYQKKATEEEGEKNRGIRLNQGDWEHVMQITGMPLIELDKLHYKCLVKRYVHNQTRLGKIRSVSALTIVGNGDGLIGQGMAKAKEDESIVATRVSHMRGIMNMKPIRRYENRTIYGTVIGKVGATTVELSSRPPGMF